MAKSLYRWPARFSKDARADRRPVKVSNVRRFPHYPLVSHLWNMYSNTTAMYTTHDPPLVVDEVGFAPSISGA